MRLAMVLGIVAGVVVAVLVLPRALDYFFQPERVAVGETFQYEGLELRVLSLERAPVSAEWRVNMRAVGGSDWTATLRDFELELEDGSRVPAMGEGRPRPSAVGELTLTFPAAEDTPPRRLLLSNPQVEFDLPSPTAAGRSVAP